MKRNYAKSLRIICFIVLVIAALMTVPFAAVAAFITIAGGPEVRSVVTGLTLGAYVVIGFCMATFYAYCGLVLCDIHANILSLREYADWRRMGTMANPEAAVIPSFAPAPSLVPPAPVRQPAPKPARPRTKAEQELAWHEAINGNTSVDRTKLPEPDSIPDDWLK